MSRVRKEDVCGAAVLVSRFLLLFFERDEHEGRLGPSRALYVFEHVRLSNPASSAKEA